MNGLSKARTIISSARPGPFLRLPDPYGDVVRRLGNLYYTINTRINLQPPNLDWPLPASTGHPAGDPYPGSVQLEWPCPQGKG